MKNLFILGIALAMVLSAGMAMAAGDQTSETFQTLGQMQTVEMTDTELNAVEGKSSQYRGYEGYRGHTGGYTQYYRDNTNSTFQLNDCFQCSADGGYGGGGNIGQSNSNYTYQSN
jgi:hypothetical protein